MAAINTAVLDRSIARALSPANGPDKLKALISALFGSVGRFAVMHGLFPEQVYMTISGARPYPEIRNLIAEKVGLDRAEVDQLIDSATATAQ